MARFDPHYGQCECCRAAFRFELIHNGFNQSGYAYCDRCGKTALLDEAACPGRDVPLPHRRIATDIEECLAACACGGAFTSAAEPRCPHCAQLLDAEKATAYIQPAVRKAAAGWMWQRNWHGLYCIVIEKRAVMNPWKSSG